jgi:hypothetical protein
MMRKMILTALAFSFLLFPSIVDAKPKTKSVEIVKGKQYIVLRSGAVALADNYTYYCEWRNIDTDCKIDDSGNLQQPGWSSVKTDFNGNYSFRCYDICRIFSEGEAGLAKGFWITNAKKNTTLDLNNSNGNLRNSRD